MGPRQVRSRFRGFNLSMPSSGAAPICDRHPALRQSLGLYVAYTINIQVHGATVGLTIVSGPSARRLGLGQQHGGRNPAGDAIGDESVRQERNSLDREDGSVHIPPPPPPPACLLFSSVWSLGSLGA
jgi:hypothetical protein